MAFHFYGEAKTGQQEFAASSSTYSAMEDDYAYLVRRWISLFFFLSCCIRLTFLPGIILSFFVLVLNVFRYLFICLFWGVYVPSDCW